MVKWECQISHFSLKSLGKLPTKVFFFDLYPFSKVPKLILVLLLGPPIFSWRNLHCAEIKGSGDHQ